MVTLTCSGMALNDVNWYIIKALVWNMTMICMTYSKRRRGRQKTRISDGIHELTEMTGERVIAKARDRATRRKQVYDVTAGQLTD